MIRLRPFVGALAALLLLAFAAPAFAAPAPANAKNVNTASAADLQTVKGVGEKTAAKIIAEREKNGAFTSLEDMQSRVRGVGEKTVERFRSAGWVATSSAKAPKQTE